jgi:WD40 repeat protein
VRMSDGTAVAAVRTPLKGHKGWVSSVSWLVDHLAGNNENNSSNSSNSQPLLASCGYDNTVNVWDLRSPDRPLHSLAQASEKLFCVDWLDGRTVVAGGADSVLHLVRL